MEDPRRREFVKKLVLLAAPILTPKMAFCAPQRKRGIHIVLPPIEFQTRHLPGRGKRVLIIGGIHGNEPGAYKAADILSRVRLKKGELFIAPRSNFVSILANVRGYNGDMNRKFHYIPPTDPDYSYVQALKELIKDVKPDAVLSLHDGFGFHAINPKCWGQCIVIDEERYENLELGPLAREVSKRVNLKIRKKAWKIPVFNTHTFSPNTRHPEQRKSLTYFCLKELKVPAFCLEVSKQLPDLCTKVRFHLLMLSEFFRAFGIETDPSLETLIEEVPKILDEKNFYSAEVSINGRKTTITSSRTISVPWGSEIKFLSVSGSSGANVIPRYVNLNWRRFWIRETARLVLKDDYRSVLEIKFSLV